MLVGLEGGASDSQHKTPSNAVASHLYGTFKGHALHLQPSIKVCNYIKKTMVSPSDGLLKLRHETRSPAWELFQVLEHTLRHAPFTLTWGAGAIDHTV